MRSTNSIKLSIHKSKQLLVTSAGLFLTILAGCDSGNTSSSTLTNSSQQTADFDLAVLDEQVVETREPGPSLGFALPPNGRIYARSDAVGAERGNEFEHSCTDGKILAGLSGHFSNRVEQVQAICVSADDNGRWIGSPAAVQNATGTTNGESFSRVCAEDHGVVGFTSDFANEYPAYLEVHCRKLDGAQKTNGDRVSLATVGTLGDDAPSSRPQCADRAVATGIYGNAQSAIERLGLVCFEDPAFAGRWSSRIDWPHIAIHNVVLSDGKLLTYGTGGSGIQGAMEFNVWDPMLGIGQSAHTSIQGTNQVDSFCSAATMLPESGDVLISGGDARPVGLSNAGIRDSTLYNAASQSVSPAIDMLYERWYPTSTTLPNGDVLVSAGLDSQRVKTPIPEVYSPASNTRRALDNASMSAYGYFYPRQFVMPNGNVFGVSSRHMYVMTTEGAGTITDVGDLPGHSFGSSATAAMYSPGKVLHAGGISNHGLGAVVIDLTSGTPSVSRSENLAQPRRAWASTVLLADGKVLMVGGSYQLNDELTASLGTEMWDPDTGTWMQYSRSELPRLYHSSAVLLMDGRVLSAGGGSPGPLTNLNGEIFSPPYLFDENGALAPRPEINYAPELAAWGQTIGIRTNDNSDISRVTLVKTSSITHGFDMDQRFLEVDFSVTADTLSLSMPNSGNVAPPGYYMLFVHDAKGTPSLARMIKLGTSSAPTVPPTNPEPEVPPVSVNSLLTNGGFEQRKQAWLDCAASTATSVSSVSAEGSNSMKVGNGGCLYQTVIVQPGATYSLSCYARGNALEYSSMSLQMLDSSYAESAASSAVIESAAFEKQTLKILAPANAAYASATFYSEGTAHIDHCELVEDASSVTTPTTPPPVSQANNLISNGDFELGKTSWNDCSQVSLTSATADSANGNSAMQVKNAGCLYQEFPITPGKTYEFSCLSKSAATKYTSMSLTLMNESYTTLANNQKPVGRNFYQSYQTSLFTPFDGRIGAVTLYSEDTAQFDDCLVVEK